MRSDKLKLIHAAFDRLHILNNLSWTHHRDRLFELTREEEKGHRGFAPEFNRHHTSDTIGINDAAKLFSVKRVADYLSGERMPRGKDFLHTHKSCFYAAGLVHEYRKAIRKAWRGLDVKALASLDYCEFVKVINS